MENYIYLIVGLLALAICLLMALLLRKNNNAELEQQVEELQRAMELLQGIHRNNGEAAERFGKSSLETMSLMGEQLKSSLNNQLGQLQTSQNNQSSQLNQALGDRLGEIRTSVDDKLKGMNNNLGESLFNLKETQAKEMQVFNEAVKERLEGMSQNMDRLQQEVTQNLKSQQQANEQKLEHMRGVLEQGLARMQADNDKKLEDIRITVGEKLQSTLEERLSQSFKAVNDNLRNVFESVGQMKELANEVGSLKNVLGNVKLRGNLGETQLAAILEEILAPDQYATNVATIPNSKERVEFAVKLPGGEKGYIYLPIDAKFPGDLYNHLQEAKQQGDKEAIQAAYKALRNKVLADAKDINSKYIKSPHTTDFGIMFLPFEGLYSEVLSLPGIIEELQSKQHIILAGPSNMVAMLQSLRMGFRTLALQKRTAEVWTTLEAVKSEFGKFGDCMEKMRGHLDKTSQELDNLMGARSRKIAKALTRVESMELEAAEKLLEIKENIDDK